MPSLHQVAELTVLVNTRVGRLIGKDLLRSDLRSLENEFNRAAKAQTQLAKQQEAEAQRSLQRVEQLTTKKQRAADQENRAVQRQADLQERQQQQSLARQQRADVQAARITERQMRAQEDLARAKARGDEVAAKGEKATQREVMNTAQAIERANRRIAQSTADLRRVHDADWKAMTITEKQQADMAANAAIAANRRVQLAQDQLAAEQGAAAAAQARAAQARSSAQGLEARAFLGTAGATAGRYAFNGGVIGLAGAATAAWEAMRWQRSLSQMQAQSVMTGPQAAQVGRYALNQGAATGASPQDILAAFRYASDKLGGGAQNFALARRTVGVSTQAALPTGTSVSDVLNAVTTAQVQFPQYRNQPRAIANMLLAGSRAGRMDLSQMVTNMPLVLAMASALGGPQALPQAIAMFSTGTGAGITPARMQTQLYDLEQHIAQPSPKSQRMLDALARRGTDLRWDFSPQGLHKIGALGVINDMKRAGLDTATIMQLVPNLRGSFAAMLLAGGQNQRMNQIYGTVLNAPRTNPMGANWNRYLGLDTTQVSRFERTLQALGIEIGQDVAPLTRHWLRDLVQWAGGAKQWVHQHQEMIRQVLSYLPLLAKMLLAYKALQFISNVNGWLQTFWLRMKELGIAQQTATDVEALSTATKDLGIAAGTATGAEAAGGVLGLKAGIKGMALAVGEALPEIGAFIILMQEFQKNGTDPGKWARDLGNQFLNSPLDPYLHKLGIPTFKDIVEMIPGVKAALTGQTSGGSGTSYAPGAYTYRGKSWTQGQGGVPFSGSVFGRLYSPQNNYQNRDLNSAQWGDRPLAQGFYHNILGGSGPYFDTDFLYKGAPMPGVGAGASSAGARNVHGGAWHLPGTSKALWTFVGYFGNRLASTPQAAGYDARGGIAEVWKTPQGHRVLFWHSAAYGTPQYSNGMPVDPHSPKITDPQYYNPSTLVPGHRYHGGQTVGLTGQQGSTDVVHLCIVTGKDGREDILALTGQGEEVFRKAGYKVRRANGTSLPPGTLRQRLAPYWGTINQVAKARHENPDLLAAIVWNESKGDPRAISSAGAIGLMQLMPGTAAQLGVDPRNPSQNINGGALYFNQLLAKAHGNVTLALEMYNAGPNATPAQLRASLPYAQSVLATYHWLNSSSGTGTPSGIGHPFTPNPLDSTWPPSGPAGWATWYNQQESGLQNNLNYLYPNLAQSKMPDFKHMGAGRRGTFDTMARQLIKWHYQGIIANARATPHMPGTQQVIAQATSDMHRYLKNPDAYIKDIVLGQKAGSNSAAQRYGNLAAQEGRQASILASAWQGVNPSKLPMQGNNGLNQQHWLHDQYRIHELRREANDNYWRQQRALNRIDDSTLKMRLRLDNQAKNQQNQASRRHALIGSGAASGVVPVHIMDRCAAEEANRKHHAKSANANAQTAKHTKTTADLLYEIKQQNGRGHRASLRHHRTQKAAVRHGAGGGLGRRGESVINATPGA